MAKKVAIRNSNIHGKGVFALEAINANGEILVMDDSHVVSNPAALPPGHMENKCDFLANGKIVLMKEPEVYINHSCSPNAYVKTIDGVRRAIALREIRVGEELTFDYAINGENEASFECNCGDKNCREVYVGNFFKLPIEIQAKYLPFLDDWFVRKYQKKIESLDR